MKNAQMLNCPSNSDKSYFNSYGYNRYLSGGKSMSQLTGDISYYIGLVDGSCWIDDYSNYPRMTERHNEGLNLAFLDGHVKWMKKTQFFQEPDRFWPGRTYWRNNGANLVP